MYYIIVNKTSGRKKKQSKRIDIVKNYLDENHIEYEWYETQYAKHPIELARQITTSHEGGNLIIIGGDGTLSEVINGMENKDKWNVGIIPNGSGNDFASNVGLNPKKPLDNLKKILEGEAKPIDLIQMNNEVCINVLGTGIDVTVLLNFEKHKKLSGSFRYFISLVEALLHTKWYEFDVSLDDGEFIHKKGFIITLCNGSTIGGGIPICPGAKVDDGKLEFVFVKEIKKRRIPGMLISLMKGHILEKDICEHIYCEKAVFKDADNFVVQVDGNLIEPTNYYTCEIIKNGLNLYR